MEHDWEPTPDPAWVLQASGFDPLRESDLEARFSIGNGFIGVRGARSVSRGPLLVTWWHTPLPTSWPRTYIAGLFDIPNTEPPVSALMPAPDWLRIQIRIDGQPLVFGLGETLSYRRTLDMRRGALFTDWRQRSASGAVVRLRGRRLVSQADRAIGLQLVRFELENDGAEVSLQCSFDSGLTGLNQVAFDKNLGIWHTNQSGKSLAIASRARLCIDGAEVQPSTMAPLSLTWNWPSQAGQSIDFERLASFARGHTKQDDAPVVAFTSLSRAENSGQVGVTKAHEAAWSDRWHCSDVEIVGDDEAQKALRFAVYHLNSAANPSDETVSIGARSLTGDSYLGHVFWDTEIYLLPFYIFTWPAAARALLMYRYNTLPKARAKAGEFGWRGAMYAWESAGTGEEQTPERIIGPDRRPVDVLCGRQEQHITADIAFAVWNYWSNSGDDDFLCAAGAEIIFETARFWTSRANLEADGKRHIRGVIGPDEFHENVDDNAYTNALAGWNIKSAIDIAALLSKQWPQHWHDLCGKIALDSSELSHWREIVASLETGFDPQTGIFEQFAGYFKLEDIDLSKYADRTVGIDSVIGRERLQQSKAVKQADVVALLALLPDEHSDATIRDNYQFYEPLCAHDSSLSHSMHALVAARIGDTENAYYHFKMSVETEFADRVGGSAGGVHIAALGGIWQATILGFAGLSTQNESIRIDPHLPSGWKNVDFNIHWKGGILEFQIRDFGTALHVGSKMKDDIVINIQGMSHTIKPEGMLDIKLNVISADQ